MRFLLVILIIAPALDAVAQETVYLGSRHQAVHVTTLALYQQYADGDDHVEEITVPISVFVPVGQNLGLSLRASPARASGRTLETVSSVSDAQASLSFSRAIGSGSAVLAVSANLPSGKSTLSQDEFETALHLSQNFYDFYVPVFGQGFNAAPSLSVAIPISDGVVVGIGAAYQVKGRFAPSSEFSTEYDPGDELLLTAGLDLRVGPGAALSGDLTYTTYGSDRIGEHVAFTSGDRVTLTTQLLQFVRRDELRVIVRYRSKGKSELPTVDGTGIEVERSVPNQFEVLGRYRTRLIEHAALTVLVQGRFYSETEAFESKSLFDVGVAPEFDVSDSVRFITRFVYTAGSFTGVTAGLGLGYAM